MRVRVMNCDVRICTCSLSGCSVHSFFIGLVQLGSVVFSTACFMDPSRPRITSSLRGFFCAISFISAFSSPAHLAIGVSHSTSLLRHPTLCFHLCTLWGVPRHAPRGSASPPCCRPPHQHGTKSQHKWDKTVVNGTRHSGPDGVHKFSVSCGRPTVLQLFRCLLLFLFCNPPMFRLVSCEGRR